LPIDPHAKVADLSISAQQRCEILKALARDVRVLILDEPTAVLTPHESRELLQWTRDFARDDCAVVLITHKLAEALEFAEDFTVLRHGRVTLSASRNDIDEAGIARAMLGSETLISERIESITHPPQINEQANDSDVVASTDSVSVFGSHGRPALRDVSIAVRRRQIVGIAAVEGSGQHELLRVLSGRRAVDRGSVVLPSNIGFIPEDRHRDALLPDDTLAVNVALRDAGARRGRMPWDALSRTTSLVLEQFDVRAQGVDTLAHTLSGGNQQKFVVGREIIDDPVLVVAENPTRGLDFNARRAVHDSLRKARDGGAAIVFYSSDLDEVLELSDLVYVLRNGSLQRPSPDRDAIGRAMLTG
jgi:simple sugar transport system ATP-binding protein